VAFQQVARKVNTNDLRVGLDRWADADPPKRAVMKTRLGESFTHRRVLNDGSHDPTAGAATARDVERAIDAVRALQTELDALK